MANNFVNDLFILDTAASTLIKAQQATAKGVSFPTVIVIKNIRWVAATTAGHACIIQDENSVVLWESLASGANYVESDLTERTWRLDFKLTTLGSGRVYITLDG